ncbi:gas vesicle protein K [Kitasatospora sp. NBC_01539]|uniref:gas vesicle protein K n=1 Tax=Kitasatospora sp. NBC_01539 TaxID=2903577 RepID=UPI0038602F72
MTGEARHPDRFGEIAEAAGRAFHLLPATSGDTRPSALPASGHLPRRITTAPDTVERDLMKLVLTVVELLRQLIERQAVRRVEAGGLTEEQEETLGVTLMTLHDRMTELCTRYDLTLQDLNLDLGPLGPLLPPPPD